MPSCQRSVALLGALLAGLAAPRASRAQTLGGITFYNYAPSGDAPLVTGSGGASDLDSFTAGQALEGYARYNVALALLLIANTKRVYFDPTVWDLFDLSSARERGDMDAAKAAAASAARRLATLKKVQGANDGAVQDGLAWAGKSPNVAKLQQSFLDYEKALAAAVADAQQVPQQMARRIQNGEAAARVFVAARQYLGKPYGGATGMTCDQLVWNAVLDAGVHLDRAPRPPLTVTGTWFYDGMGPEFKQVLGGDKGIALKDLATGIDAGTVTLPPLGSVLVTDGHAAVFSGVITIQGHTQLVLFDANNSAGWSVTLAGVPIPGDPKDALASAQAFPGHQVGEHVTRLQWGNEHAVKVFQPIGDHGTRAEAMRPRLF